MDSANLVSCVRAGCGKVTNITELDDTDVAREGGYILDRIAERIPVKKLRSFTSIADERAYDAHANTMRVQIVFPSAVITEYTNLWGGNLGIPSGLDSVNTNEYYNFPSLKMIDNIRVIRGLQKVRFEFNPVERKINIDPAPGTAGDVYYYLSVERADWTMAKVPTDFEEVLILGTTWKCLEIIMMKRTQLGGIPRVGGFVDYPADRLMPFIKEKRDEFEAKLNIKAKLHMR